MDDESLFRVAKWLREANYLQGAGAINKTTERVTITIEGQTVDLARLDTKIQELDLGLAPEDEFLALSIWMGNCLAIHKLEQEIYPLSARQGYKIPDYLAVYKYKRQLVPALVEVKSTFGEKELEFTASYYEKLMKYAQLVKLPLLIAWKYKDWGFWCLFELERMQKRVSAFHIEFLEALKNDLTGVLLGNIHLTVKAGTRFVMRIEKIREQSPTTFEGIIRDAYWANSKGVRISPEPRHFTLFFLQCEDDVEVVDDGKIVTQSFFTTQDWGVIAYKLLATALRFPKLAQEEQIDWVRIVRDQSFRVSYADIVKSAKDGLTNGLVTYIVHQVPAKTPDFLASTKQ